LLFVERTMKNNIPVTEFLERRSYCRVRECNRPSNACGPCGQCRL